MNREVHVRFCESLGVRFPRATHHQLHWVLDVAFSDDQARHRAGNTAHNMTTLRHCALNIVKQDKTRKVGVATCRKRAGWDRNYLLELLAGV